MSMPSMGSGNLGKVPRNCWEKFWSGVKVPVPDQGLIRAASGFFVFSLLPGSVSRHEACGTTKKWPALLTWRGHCRPLMILTLTLRLCKKVAPSPLPPRGFTIRKEVKRVKLWQKYQEKLRNLREKKLCSGQIFKIIQLMREALKKSEKSFQQFLP